MIPTLLSYNKKEEESRAICSTLLSLSIYKAAETILGNLLGPLGTHAQAFLNIGLGHLETPILHHQHGYTTHKASKKLPQAQG